MYTTSTSVHVENTFTRPIFENYRDIVETIDVIESISYEILRKLESIQEAFQEHKHQDTDFDFDETDFFWAIGISKSPRSMLFGNSGKIDLENINSDITMEYSDYTKEYFFRAGFQTKPFAQTKSKELAEEIDNKIDSDVVELRRFHHKLSFALSHLKHIKEDFTKITDYYLEMIKKGGESNMGLCHICRTYYNYDNNKTSKKLDKFNRNRRIHDESYWHNDYFLKNKKY